MAKSRLDGVEVDGPQRNTSVLTRAAMRTCRRSDGATPDVVERQLRRRWSV